MEENEAPAPPAPSGRIIPPEEFPGVVHDVADTMELTPAQPAAWDRLAEHDNALRAEVAAATTRAEQAEADLAAARESLGAANDNAEKWRKAGIKAGEEIAALKAKIAAFPVCHLESCVTCAATEARAEKAEAEASRLRGALERIVKHGAADPWLTAIAREALDKTKVPK
jgi:chromosome segregation ATPase